jgi:DNA-binding NarL/FixJ family response regulator
MIRVLLVDDQPLLRSGFRALLNAEDDIEVVAEGANGREGLTLARQHLPDLALVDIQMPVMDGIETTRQIAADPDLAGMRVVILTNYGLDEYVFNALRAGAAGFLVKDIEPVDLVHAVRVAERGDALLAPSITRRLIHEFARAAPAGAPPPGFSELTAREVEVFKLVARGLSNAEIAAELIVSETTVKTHVARLLMKLGIRDRVQAVVLAYESGIAVPGGAGA